MEIKVYMLYGNDFVDYIKFQYKFDKHSVDTVRMLYLMLIRKINFWWILPFSDPTHISYTYSV